jgi:HK97 family phage major capsid protein
MYSTEQKLIHAMQGIVDIQTFLTGPGPRESLGEKIATDPDAQKFLDKGSDFTSIKLSPLEFKTAILSTSAQNDPLVTAYRPDIAPGAIRKLQVRDLLSAGTTDQGAIEYPVEASFTNNAGVQVGGSPEAFENVSLGESGATFTLSFQPVITIGHWVSTSKQVIQDSSVLQAFLSNRLMYGLKLEEEDQILNGSGSNGELSGLIAGATAYTVQSPQLTNEVDIIRDCIEQLQVADYSPDAIVINPVDWYSVEIRKASGSDDTYASGDPRLMGEQPRLWGLPVVVTNTIASGTCLVGDFRRAAALFDREEATIEISRKHSDNMEKNMVTILAQERIGLVVTNALAMVKATI